MNKTTKLSLIAAAMGGLMAGAASSAMASTPAPTGKATVVTKATKAVNAGVRALEDDKDAGKHDCKGQNECKGKGGCKSGDAGCKGKNTCKGHGGCKSAGDEKSHG
ncbi:hypothetical protein BH10PLA1_BH10PLA1_07900 [soil metagenome]